MGETWFPPWERVGGERRSLALGLLEAKVLVVEPVPELRALGLQVVAVLVVRRDLDRHLLDDRQAEALDARDLLRVVREDSNRREPEIGEDLVADPVFAHVGRETELEVGLDGVHPVLLELVGLQLVEKADAPALLRHVEEYAALLGADPRERLLELLAAVAAERVEDVSGQTLGVDADEDILLALDVALDERDVVLAGQLLPEGDRNEVSVRRRYSIRSSTVIILRSWREQYSTRSGTRAIVPSSFITSQTTPAGLRPARRARSTAASVCPARWRTPPTRARRGKTWPGWTRSSGPLLGSMATWIVRARSWAEIPVETPSRASIDTVKAVPNGVSFRSVICSSASSSQRSSVRQRQISPRPCVAMKLTASGVANWAAMVRSPSFSRSAASTTTMNLPCRTSSSACSIVAKGVSVAVWVTRES